MRMHGMLLTQRTFLRRLRLDDERWIRTLESDADVMRSTGLRRVQTEAQTRARL